MGQPVLAGSFLRRREIIVDAELFDASDERARILTHELFHFVWLRLGNGARSQWSGVVEAEIRLRARGELGWSSEWRKRALLASSGTHSRQWREYICESFCDTAAWLYAGLDDHDEFTLARRWRVKRRTWFERAMGSGGAIQI